MLEEGSFILESQGRLNKLIKNMAGSVLCSRGMGLNLMSGLTSGNVAGGTNMLEPCDKACATAASPLLLSLIHI